MNRLMRIFPRRTSYTPEDEMTRTTAPGWFDECDEAHVSCTFSWDLPAAEKLAEQWSRVVKTELGGPATGQRAEGFTPGLYIRHGYTFTSRGCPNKCWFCDVWRRDGGIRELPIADGWIIQDDNLLACSEKHIRAVFDMLKRQPKPATFAGGIEAKILKPWHVELFANAKVKQMFFAYDTPDDYEPLLAAGKLFVEAGFSREKMRCYVLIGHSKDTMEDAEKRLYDTLKAGYFPFAMTYRGKDGKKNMEFSKLQREWARPALMRRKIKEVEK